VQNLSDATMLKAFGLLRRFGLCHMRVSAARSEPDRRKELQAAHAELLEYAQLVEKVSRLRSQDTSAASELCLHISAATAQLYSGRCTLSLLKAACVYY
jgi:hypothetical protein